MFVCMDVCARVCVIVHCDCINREFLQVQKIKITKTNSNGRRETMNKVIRKEVLNKIEHEEELRK